MQMNRNKPLKWPCARRITSCSLKWVRPPWHFLLRGVLLLPIIFGACRHESVSMACVTNLKTIEGAKSVWAIENQKTTDDALTDSDLFGPDKTIREKPLCPQGGTYKLGRAGEKPKCSVKGHTL
jgi:hypothetical protein